MFDRYIGSDERVMELLGVSVDVDCVSALALPPIVLVE